MDVICTLMTHIRCCMILKGPALVTAGFTIEPAQEERQSSKATDTNDRHSSKRQTSQLTAQLVYIRSSNGEDTVVELSEDQRVEFRAARETTIPPSITNLISIAWEESLVIDDVLKISYRG